MLRDFVIYFSRMSLHVTGEIPSVTTATTLPPPSLPCAYLACHYTKYGIKTKHVS